MNRSEIENGLIEIAEMVLHRKVDLESTRQKDTDWDSLAHIQIVFSAEEKFAVRLSEDEIASADSIQKLADIVLSRQ